jgi:hypothetical protein
MPRDARENRAIGELRLTPRGFARHFPPRFVISNCHHPDAVYPGDKAAASAAKPGGPQSRAVTVRNWN